MIAQQSRDLDTVGEQPKSPEAQNSELAALQAQEADLTSRYTSDYPDVVAVKRKIQELRDQIAKGPAPVPASSTPAAARREPLNVTQMRLQLRAIEQSMEDKKREEAQLNTRIAQYQGRLQSSPMVQEEYKTLTRDYQTTQTFYDSLLKNVNESKMATDLEMRQQGEQFKVMDPPNLPEGPVFPKRNVFLGGGFAAGLLIGLLAVGWIEYRDTAIRSERDLWAFTRLPTLAVIALTQDAAPEKRRWFRFGRHKGKDDTGAANKPLVNAGA
jgi:uncharacterized protein involved in exopolysaccharide biosynthesis